MVVLSSTLKGRVFKFQSKALGPRDLYLSAFTGVERMSQPFRFEMELVSERDDIDSAAMLAEPCFLGIKMGIPLSGGEKRGVRSLKLHGVLESFQQSVKGKTWVMYRAVLRPRLWQLSLSHQSRVFLDKSVPDIVEEVLKDSGFGSDDYELRLGNREYPKREYTVQYQESDLDFISRLLEHEGIFYFFEDDDERDIVVFGDSVAAHPSVVGENELPYRPDLEGQTREKASAGAGSDWFDQAVIFDFNLEHTRIPKEVVLKEYNYRTPKEDLKVDSPVVEDGFGKHYEYGNHFKDKKEGKALATVRAEELIGREKLYRGRGEGRSFRPGAIYIVDDHYREDFCREYMLTEVNHTGKQIISAIAPGSPVASYENNFVSLASDVVFRPERRTPKPRIRGTLNAKVDAASDGQYAEIDDQGRYKVILPFDLSGRDKGKASRFIRMAQPYTGPDYGFHFPLHKDAEVILTHVDGDPDRPIIASAVPNPDTASPVKGANQSQAVIKTAGGNQLVIEDTDGSQSMSLFSPVAGTGLRLGKGSSGFQWDTAGDGVQRIKGMWDNQIIGDVIVDVGGAEHKITAGHTSELKLSTQTTVTVGAKLTYELALALTGTSGVKVTFANATEYKRVAGLKFENDDNKVETVPGTKKSTVGGLQSADIGGLYKVTAGGAIDLTAGGRILNKAAGPVDITAGAKVFIAAGGALKATSGGATTIQAGGAAELRGANVYAIASGAAQISGKPVNVVSNAAMELRASGSNLLKGSDVIVKGGTITLDGAVDAKKKVTIKGSALVVS